MPPKKILVTGVYGLIAGDVYAHFQEQPEKYDVYALARRRYPSDRAPDGRELNIPDDHFHLADLTDFDAILKAVTGMHTVVQMAADPRPEAAWEQIRDSNMIGAYNVFEACRQAGVKRILYASSVMASWGYQHDEPYKAIKERRYEDVPDPFRSSPTKTRPGLPNPTPPAKSGAKRSPACIRTYTASPASVCASAGSTPKTARAATFP